MTALRTGVDETIDDDEELARFLTSPRQFNSTTARPTAFLPSGGETSVFRHGAEPSGSLWQIGRDNIVDGRTLLGAAILQVRQIRTALLDVIPVEPPPRHAVIVGWPVVASEPDIEKAQQRQRALMLASRATLLRLDSDAVS